MEDEVKMDQGIQSQCFLGMPIVFASATMRGLIDRVKRIAVSYATCLVRGESGCGKELIARALHHYSLRAHKPWVDLSCGALPENLVESELFGYEKGAFSGADSSKPGLFELAHQGTIFLDEVGELDAKMQVKLLRVLDGAPYYRLGGVKKVTVDVRIVAATNQNLEEMVRQGRFRSDLFHRLAQIELQVPPLRERPDDILPIAELFLSQQNPDWWFSEGAVRALESHSWPGNVRELRNVILKCAVLANGPELDTADLPLEITRFTDAASADLMPLVKAVGAPASGAVDGNGMLEGLERQTILKVLAETGGHHQRAANLLGISRRTLSRKLKMYENEIGAGASATRGNA